MKKHLLLVLAGLLTFSVNGQITLDSTDLFQAGDNFKMLKGNNPNVIDVKGNGNNNWDFSRLATDSLIDISTRTPNRGMYPVDSLFPDANTVFDHQEQGVTYLINSADSIMIDGVLDYAFVLGVKMNINFDDNVTLMRFPFTYQDQINSTTVIDTTVDTSFLFYDKVRIVATLKYITDAEGYGNLKTVQTTFNTLKLYTLETRDLKAYGRSSINGQWNPNPLFTQLDTLHRYRWFAKGEGYQVAEAVTDERDGICTSASYLLNDSLFAYIDDKGNPTCFGNEDGFAEVKVVGGSGFRTALWSASANNQGTFKATNLAAGIHYVTVTDQITNATFVDSVELVEPDSISISTISKLDESPIGNDGSIEITASGGNPPYTFSWDKSTSTDAKANDLVGGEHMITVSDSNSCSKIHIESIGSFVGIGENNQFYQVKVFPNPSHGEFIISLGSPATVQLIDPLGNIILEKSQQHHYEMNVAKQTGLYFLIIKGEQIEKTIPLYILD